MAKMRVEAVLKAPLFRSPLVPESLLFSYEGV
jgi:hypothetical protein